MPNTNTNFDKHELAKFEALAYRWWDTENEFKPLHDINPLRLNFIDEHAGLKSKKILDIGNTRLGQYGGSRNPKHSALSDGGVGYPWLVRESGDLFIESLVLSVVFFIKLKIGEENVDCDLSRAFNTKGIMEHLQVLDETSYDGYAKSRTRFSQSQGLLNLMCVSR